MVSGLSAALLSATLLSTSCVGVLSELTGDQSGDDSSGLFAALFGGAQALVAGQIPGFNPGSPSLSASQYIRADQGGVIYLNNEARLTIPAGSLSEDTTITIEKLESAPEADAYGFQKFGQGYRFSPAGTQFDAEKPAVLAIRYDGAALANAGLDVNQTELFYYNEDMGRYVNVAGGVDTNAGEVTALIEHFTVYIPAARAAQLAGNAAPIVAYQDTQPNPVRAGAPFYVRFLVNDPDPETGTYGGGAIASVQLEYRKLQPAPGAWIDAGQMIAENNVNPIYGSGTLRENTYGYIVPHTFWSTNPVTDLNTAAGQNDVEFRVTAIDNLGAQTTITQAINVTRVHEATGAFTLGAPTTAPITAGFSRTYRLRGQDRPAPTGALGNYTMTPTANMLSVTNAIGTFEVVPGAQSIVFKAVKRTTGTLVATMGATQSDIEPITVTNGRMTGITLLDTNGQPFPTGTITLPGRSDYAFDLRGYDAFGNFIDVAPSSWNLTAGLGTVDADGLLTTGNTALIGTVTANVGAFNSAINVNVIPRYQVSVNFNGNGGGPGAVDVQLNGGETLSLSAPGVYNFNTYLANLAAYTVKVTQRPSMRGCNGGTGFVATADPAVTVNCLQLMGGGIITLPGPGNPTGGLQLTPIVSTLAGSTAGTGGYIENTGGLARFSNPLACTSDGNFLYVSDYSNHVIRRINRLTGETQAYSGKGTVPGYIGTVTGAFGINLTEYRHNFPYGMVTDGTYLYISEGFNYMVRKVRIDAVIPAFQSNPFVEDVAGAAGVTGYVDGIGSAARFGILTGLTIDGSNLYVADNTYHVVRKINIATRQVSLLAGGVGQPGSADGVGNAARFNGIHGLTTDGTYVYVADSLNYRIRRIEIATGTVTTLAGSTFGAADGVGTAAQFLETVGLSYDGRYLYATDTSAASSFVRRIDPTDGTVTTIFGGPNGYLDGATGVAFRRPHGVCAANGELYVTDYLNNSVRVIR